MQIGSFAFKPAAWVHVGADIINEEFTTREASRLAGWFIFNQARSCGYGYTREILMSHVEALLFDGAQFDVNIALDYADFFIVAETH